jgi:uncharacterized Zn ribbon protein
MAVILSFLEFKSILFNGHNIEAKVPGFGMMMLKSEIVRRITAT